MSVAIATENKTRYTPEDLLPCRTARITSWSMAGSWSETWGRNRAGSREDLYLRLSRFCEEHRLGCVWPSSNGYQCFPHAPELVRRPDVSFIRAGRLPGDELPKGHVRIAPDLAVEVVSPRDLAPKLDEKLEDYQKAGRAPGLG